MTHADRHARREEAKKMLQEGKTQEEVAQYFAMSLGWVIDLDRWTVKARRNKIVKQRI